MGKSLNTLDIADAIELKTWASKTAYSISSLEADLFSLYGNSEAGEIDLCCIQVFEELLSRKHVLKSYPFDCDGNVLQINALSSSSSYIFCLALSLLDGNKIPLDMRTRQFESLAMKAAEAYFNGEGVRVGAPWSTPEIPDYETLLNKVSDLIPDLGPPAVRVAPGGGDGGWDIVIVCNFPDKKFSRTIVLGNCATGKTDWRNKGFESQPAAFWDNFARSGPRAHSVCIKFIAFPFSMEEKDISRKAGVDSMPFDRLRICAFATEASQEAMQWVASNTLAISDLALI